jgi:hypothetical protein
MGVAVVRQRRGASLSTKWAMTLDGLVYSQVLGSERRWLADGHVPVELSTG